MTVAGLPAGIANRARRLTASRWPRVAAALSAAFTGAHPELVSNVNWPGSTAK